MDKTEIQKRVITVVAHVLKRDAAEITEESNFIFDFGADSQQSLELIVSLEKEFNIKMDAEKALAVQTVSDTVAFVAECLK